MARLSTAAANAAAAAVTGLSTHLGLHTADPGTTGASEVAGGTYARQATTWGSPSGGVVSNTNAISVPVPASTTVSYAGGFAGTAGAYEIGIPLTSSISIGATAGTVTFAAGAVTVTGS